MRAPGGLEAENPNLGGIESISYFQEKMTFTDAGFLEHEAIYLDDRAAGVLHLVSWKSLENLSVTQSFRRYGVRQRQEASGCPGQSLKVCSSQS